MAQRVLETDEEFDRAAVVLLTQLADLSVAQADAVLKRAGELMRQCSTFDEGLKALFPPPV